MTETTQEIRTYRTRREAVEVGLGMAEDMDLGWKFVEGSAAKGLAFGDTGSYTIDREIEVRRAGRRFFLRPVERNTYSGNVYGESIKESEAVGRITEDHSGISFLSYSGR